MGWSGDRRGHGEAGGNGGCCGVWGRGGGGHDGGGHRGNHETHGRGRTRRGRGGGNNESSQSGNRYASDYDFDIDEIESPWSAKTVAADHVVVDAARRTNQCATLHGRPHTPQNTEGGALGVRNGAAGHRSAAQVQGIKHAMARH